MLSRTSLIKLAVSRWIFLPDVTLLLKQCGLLMRMMLGWQLQIGHAQVVLLSVLQCGHKAPTRPQIYRLPQALFLISQIAYRYIHRPLQSFSGIPIKAPFWNWAETNLMIILQLKPYSLSEISALGNICVLIDTSIFGEESKIFTI